MVKKKHRKLMNKVIVGLGSVFTIYVLFFNNALQFLSEVGINVTDNGRVITGLIGFVFVISYLIIKLDKGKI